MVYTAMTKKAMKIAYKAHEGQLDKNGMPYIYHVAHVAEQMGDELSATVALLHDVLEDTGVTYSDLEKAGFPEIALESVAILTHKEGVSYLDYIREVKKDPIACAVKRADLIHNSDITRLDNISRDDSTRLCIYEEALMILMKN